MTLVTRQVDKFIQCHNHINSASLPASCRTSKRQCLAHLEDYIEKSPIKSHVGRTLFRRFIVNQVKEYGKHIKMIPQLDEKDQAVNSLLKDREIAESEFASRSIVGKKHCLVFAVLLYGLVHELYPNHAP